METMEVELPNGSDGDALVHVRLRSGRGLVFDAGDTRRLAARDVLRLSHLFFSHCHVDHFIGLDALVRPRVCRPERLDVLGPSGFLDRVAARLSGYTWNLVEGNHFVLTAAEVGEEEMRYARFDSGRGFVREDLGSVARPELVAHDEDFVVRSAALDHHVVSQGWALEGRMRWSVRSDAFPAHGLAPGPWVADLKRAAEAGADRREPFAPPGAAARPLGEWLDALTDPRPGERLAFVTDTVCDATTRPRIVALADRADVFAAGAPFLSSELDRATATRHLTARQAGEMAAEAGARKLLLFHVSDRYGGVLDRHADEAREAARGRVEVEVRAALPVAEG